MEKYASSPQEGNYVLIEYDSKQEKYIGNISIQNELKDKYIIAKVYENSSLKLRANPSICIIPPLQNFIIQVSTNNHLIEENPSIKFQIICVPTENNIIEHQNSKLNIKKGKIKNELYITNPTKVVNNINNELIKYKDMYKELTTILKDNRENIEKYETKIIELQNENQNLRNEYKTYIFNSNKERETLMNTIQNERNYIK